MLNSQAIVKSIKDPDDNMKSGSLISCYPINQPVTGASPKNLANGTDVSMSVNVGSFTPWKTSLISIVLCVLHLLMSAGQPVTAGNLFTAKGMEFYYPTGHYRHRQWNCDIPHNEIEP